MNTTIQYMSPEYIFLNSWHTLSFFQKEIWKLLRYMALRMPHVFPSQTTIAKKIRCDRTTVNRAVKLFVEMGWLKTERRCYRSSMYYLDPKIGAIDPQNHQNFHAVPQVENQKNPYVTSPNATERATERATIDIYNAPTENDYVKSVAVSSKEKMEKLGFSNRPIYPFLQTIGLKEQDQRLISRYEERIVGLALEDCRSYAKKFRVHNKAALLEKRCQHYANLT